MPSENYWEERFLALEEAQKDRSEAYYAKVAASFDLAVSAIEREIAAWYAKFAKRENISLSEAKRLLRSNELEEFKMSLEEYIQKATDPKFKKQLERVSAKVHVSRLEALEIQLKQLIYDMFSEYEGSIDDFLITSYENNYYHAAYEIAVGTNEGMALSVLAKDEIAAIVTKPWAVDGKTFSERIWGNKEKLINDIHAVLTQGFATGAGQWKMTKELVKRTGVSYSNAARLIATESSFVRSVADKNAFNDTGVEQYKLVATLDKRTSQICRSMDGKVFKMSEFEIGVTAPPFHPRCRTTKIPYFGVTYGKRAARDKEGNTIYVPADMKYQDWYDKFIGN
mgnify:FL=1